MTDNEIIKALECCIKAKSWGDCEDLGCPATRREGCYFYLRTDNDDECAMYIEILKAALDLINRQKAEIERLKKLNDEGAECPTCHGMGKIGTTDWLTRGLSKEQIAKEKAEAVEEFHRQLKAEAIKEFAEAVKMEFYREFDEIIPSIMADRIDNLVKEITEGNHD